MATLVLAAAGSAIGGAIGGSVLGISAAVIGQTVGAYLGSRIDAALAPGLPTVTREGPRINTLDVMTANAGDPLADISGRAAIAGTVIWATKIKESRNTDRDKVKTGKRSSQTVKTVTYSYSVSMAIALGEGPLAPVYGRIWADGKVCKLSVMKKAGRIRYYSGTEDQAPDPLIAAKEGGAAPAFRGVAYMVFEDLELEDFGNRPPQIKVEVWGRSGDMEPLVRGVNVIPGSTEAGYDPEFVDVISYTGIGDVKSRFPMNGNRDTAKTDWTHSMELLDATLPNADTVSLVVAWFGDDLRAGQCTIQPRVEYMQRDVLPRWTSAGLTYSSDWYRGWWAETTPRAQEVSRTADGTPSYGSSPSDGSIVRAIQDLKSRGKRVVLYPFVMMDVTEAQALPDPSGTGVQPDYPWRGRLRPMAGNDVAAEVAAFMGGAWGFRNFILHLSSLAATAGGVDAILIGSEMRGMSMAHAGSGSFPFVDALKVLAGDVRAILPAAEIGYAADWSEYHSFREGSDVYFHLDPLWSDPNIDFVGIDNYLPLSDWRDGPNHMDRNDATGVTSPYVLDYLKSNIEGGEYWDWYYASDTDREAQIRTPIADAAHGEHWVFRQKAIRDWHGQAHHNRPGGTRDTSATAWTPGSKPVWFTELGCPAVDKGANQPNVFAARYSSESALPWFSQGFRDDFMQRQFLRASFEWWAENGGSAVDPANIQVWAWDARPFPEFPQNSKLWSDGPDWRLGHWLNGRAGAAPAGEAIRRRAVERYGLDPGQVDIGRAFGQADGYAAPGLLGFREYVQPLELAHGLQSHEEGGRLVFGSRGTMPTVSPLTPEGMTPKNGDSPFTVTRSALEDVAAGIVLTFRDGADDYAHAATRAVIGRGPEDGEAATDLPLVLDHDRGTAAADRMVRAARDGRETITFRVPRSATHIRPGVVVPVVIDGAPRLFAVQSVADGLDRAIEAQSFAAGAWAPSGGGSPAARAGGTVLATGVLLILMDLPTLPGFTAEDWDGFAAALGLPWPGSVVASRSQDATGGFLDPVAFGAPAVMGETLAELPQDIPGAWRPGPLDVALYSGELVPRDPLDVLAGRNMLAVKHPAGWEVIRFTGVELLPGGTGRYRLTGLLRGDRGTEAIPAAAPLAATAPVVLLDAAVQPLGLELADMGRSLYWRFGPGNEDVTTHDTKPHTFTGAGLRPFAPAHLAATPSGGDLDLSWVRRSRVMVDTLGDTLADPPLGETAEMYLVEIGPAAAPVRTWEVTGPAATYTAAQIASDAIAAPYRVAVAQVSETYGPGSWAEITVEA